jgi:hypothetical protein
MNHCCVQLIPLFMPTTAGCSTILVPLDSQLLSWPDSLVVAALSWVSCTTRWPCWPWWEVMWRGPLTMHR